MPTRTVSNAGGNWDSVGTWVEGAVPTSADDVVFTATSGNVTVNVAGLTRGINFANYVGTMTFLANISIIGGGLNLGTGGYTLTGTGGSGFAFGASCSITSNGVLCQRGISFGGTNQTYTLVDVFDVPSTFVSATTFTTINGAELRTGNIIHNTSAIVQGTSKIVFNKTATWSHSSTGVIRNNLDINLVGTLTLSGTVRYDTRTLTYITGTVVATGSTLNIAASTTLNTSSVVWNTISTTTGVTLTLNSILNASTFSQTGGNVVFAGSFGFNIGTLTIQAARTLTLQNSVTYDVNTLITRNTGSISTITSNSGTLRATLHYNRYNVNTNIGNFSLTRINARGGFRILTAQGMVHTDCMNVSKGEGDITQILMN
jgi:hypothetical protein